MLASDTDFAAKLPDSRERERERERERDSSSRELHSKLQTDCTSCLGGVSVTCPPHRAVQPDENV